MSIFSKTGLIADITNNIYTNVQRLIKGNTLKSRLLNIVDSTFIRVVDTAANFTTNNPILNNGEIGIESDSLNTVPKFKIGDGNTSWDLLPYANSGISNVNYIADTAANLTANNPIMPDGYFGIESDTLLTNPKFKIAASSTPWNSLPYANAGGSQTLAQTLANGALTNEIDITSNDGNSKARINNGDVRFEYSPGSFGAAFNGLRADGSSTKIKFTDGTIEVGLESNAISSTLNHSVLIDLNAPSVTKNGVEVATVNDIPSVAGLAPIASPTFTGTPLAPTASANTNNTQIATTAYVDDLKANFINKKNSDTPHTGTTSPTVIHSFEITPGTCQANDVLKFYIRHFSTNNANSKAVKIKANSSNTIVGATQLSNYEYWTNSGGVFSFKRSLIFKNSLTSQKIINTTVTHANDEVSYPNNVDSTLSLNFNNSVFIFIEVTLANAADIFTMNLFNCKIER